MYMTCSICKESKHDDEYEYFDGKDAAHDPERVCDKCVGWGLDLLRNEKRFKAESYACQVCGEFEGSYHHNTCSVALGKVRR